MDAGLTEFWEEYNNIPFTVVPGAGYALHLILCIAKHAACFATAQAHREGDPVSAERCFTKAVSSFLTMVGTEPDAFEYHITGTTIDAAGRVWPQGGIVFNGTHFAFHRGTGQLVLD